MIDAVGAVRGLMAVFGTILFVIGIAALLDRGGSGSLGGLWLIGTGAVLLAAVLLERARYRSTAADPTDRPVGPGGGEPRGEIEPRFVPTQEVFIDPTSQHRMRVFIDHRTGERRYRAED